MNRTRKHVLRYRLVDASRGEVWHPVDNAWQTPCSAVLVAHDLFHHLPSDSGTFAEEVATLGAEYYINYQGSGISETPGLNALSRAAAGIVGIAIEGLATARQALQLPPARTRPLAEPVEALFLEVARSAYAQLCEMTEGDERWNRSREVFSDLNRFVSLMRSGYRTARRRFPDQLRVRAAFRDFEGGVHDAEEEMAVGEMLTVARVGYDATVSFSRPVPFNEDGYLPAYLMTWSLPNGSFGSAGGTLHRSREEYEEFVERYFNAIPEAEFDLHSVPDFEAEHLRRVLVGDGPLKDVIAGAGVHRFSTSDAPRWERQPCGAWVLPA